MHSHGLEVPYRKQKPENTHTWQVSHAQVAAQPQIKDADKTRRAKQNATQSYTAACCCNAESSDHASISEILSVGISLLFCGTSSCCQSHRVRPKCRKQSTAKSAACVESSISPLSVALQHISISLLLLLNENPMTWASYPDHFPGHRA